MTATRKAIAAAAACALFGACGGGTAAHHIAHSLGAEAAPASTDAHAQPLGGAGASPSAGRAGAPTTTWRPRMLNGVKEAPPAPPGYTGLDAFDRRAHLPPGAVPVIKGHGNNVEWRLYAYFDKKDHTCVQFADQSTLDSNGAGSGGAAGTCNQRPPLDPSSLSAQPFGTWVFGLTYPSVAAVRVEHSDGSSETFQTVGSPGFADWFYAGALQSAASVTRVVALDGNGKVVAVKTDNKGMIPGT